MSDLKSLFNLNPKSLLSIALILLTWTFVSGQPDGGPYGPVQMNYSLPDVPGRLWYAAPDGKDAQTGDDPALPVTIEKAIREARSGDAIILRGGTYRTGNLRFNQGITIQPWEDEQPVLKGTFIADQWEKESDNLWSTYWERLFPAGPEDWWHRDREEKFTPLHRFNDDLVFIDGRFLQSAGNTEEVDTGTFFIDYAKQKVYIGVDPANKLVEITAFNVALHRVHHAMNGIQSDSAGPVIRGLTITQYADSALLIKGHYPEGPTDESLYGNDVVGTAIENCDISYASRIGAYIMGDSLTVRNCRISNTSREGLYLVGASDVLLENNIFSRNNIELITGCYPAAVKIFNQCYRVTCKNNFVTDLPNSNGIWYDVGNVDGVFINNWVENVGSSQEDNYPIWRNMSGFFFEISKTAVAAGNVFLNCDNGSFVLNSSDVRLYHNTYINSQVVFMRTERSAANDHFGWHPATGPDVDERTGHEFVNNLVYQNEGTRKFSALSTWQPDSLCYTLERMQLERLDHNVYVRDTTDFTYSLIRWNALINDSCNHAVAGPAELHDLHPGFSGNSVFLPEYTKPVFMNAWQREYQLKPGFGGLETGSIPPADVAGYLGLEKGKAYSVGAWPVSLDD